jgi:hypothetical protein
VRNNATGSVTSVRHSRANAVKELLVVNQGLFHRLILLPHRLCDTGRDAIENAKEFMKKDERTTQGCRELCL